MNKDINEKLNKLLGGLGASKLNMEEIAELAKSEEGQRLKNSLSESDRRAILKKFMSLDEADVAAKLKNADLSGMGKLSVNDIIKKLR